MVCEAHQPPSADSVVDRIKAGELDPYKALEKYVSALAGRGLAPKTIRGYLTATRGLLRHEGIKLDDYEVRLKVGVPPDIESSLDRIPTRELRLLLMNSDPRTRALISLLATSGLRIGEASTLRLGNVDLDREKVTVMALKTKSRATRISFISTETARLLRDYLRQRINHKDEWLFPDKYNPQKPAGRSALYQLIRRTLTRTGLRSKLDPDSRMYELNPHAFRKYFFTKLIGAGVDRGVAEYLMGHKFGLDSAYLRMDEERLRREYMESVDDFQALTETKPDRKSQEEMTRLRQQIEQLQFAVRVLQDASGLKASVPA